MFPSSILCSCATGFLYLKQGQSRVVVELSECQGEKTVMKHKAFFLVSQSEIHLKAARLQQSVKHGLCPFTLGLVWSLQEVSRPSLGKTL